MRAYADTLVENLATHAPTIEPELIELDPVPSSLPWRRRLQTMLLPLRARMHRSRAPDLWHILDGSRAHLVPALSGAPVCVTVHDIIPWLQGHGRFPGAPPLRSAAHWLWRRNGLGIQRADQLLCVSECSARDVQKAFAIAPSVCRVLPLPLRSGLTRYVPSSIAATGGDRTVLHVGHNGFYKNRDGVLRVFARLGADIGARLVMAGPEPTKDLLSLSSELGIADRIEWLRDPGDAELAACYQGASVFLFPSLYEGFGWPLLEAMSFGLPVIASDCGSIPEVVGNAARCFPVSDEAGMAEAVEHLLREPSARIEAGQRGIAHSSGFTSRRFAESMQDAYLEAASTQFQRKERGS